MFGLHLLQLLGHNIKLMNENILILLLRKLYFSITKIEQNGKVILKPKNEISNVKIEEIQGL